MPANIHLITFHLVYSFISETLITNNTNNNYRISFFHVSTDRLCGLVVRVPGYRSRGPGPQTMRHHQFTKVGTNLSDLWRSLDRHSSLSD
jgi:hypothetical protein